MAERKRHVSFAALSLTLFMVLLGLAAAVYQPGLRSAYILDDTPNLLPLETIDDGDSESFWNYVLTGRSGPTGRPLSLLTFAFQKNAWPNNPQPIKAVNLSVHLGTAMLLYWFVLLLARARRMELPHLLALIVAGAWLVLPIHVNTVLYAVQRMTLLAGFFSLLGIAGYLSIRERPIGARATGGVAALSWLFACTLLATLSKEIGLLTLPLTALVELAVSRTSPPSTAWRRLVWSAHGLILFTASAAFLVKFRSLVLAGYNGRPFTLSERLLTESRALVDYTLQILIPSRFDLSLFHDDYPLISSFTEAAPYLAIILAAILAAVVLWKRIPLFSFGIAWFLVGHAMESTVIPLEIYFEHRNYLPSIGLLIAVAGLLQFITVRFAPRIRAMAAGAAFGVAAVIYLAMSANIAILWTRPLEQSYIWAMARPDSTRAQLLLIANALTFQQYDLARLALKETRRRFPGLPHPDLYAISAQCETDAIPLPVREETVRRILETPKFNGVYDSLNSLITKFEEGKECRHLDLPWLEALLQSWAEQEKNASNLRRALMLLARVEYQMSDLRSAMIHLNVAAELGDFGTIRITQAVWLLNAGYLEDARMYLQLARETVQESGYRAERQLAQIEKDIQTASTNRQSDSTGEETSQ